MQTLNRFKLIIGIFTLLLNGCFDDNAEQCQHLMNDEAKRGLSVSYCEKAANSGDALSQTNFAILLLEQNKIDDAVKFFEKAANQKNGEAAYNLAQIYEQGRRENQIDLDSAEFYYQKSCEYGELKGCERSRALIKQQSQKEKADQIALEKAKAETLAQEQAKFEAEAKAKEQQRLNDEAKQRKAEADALKAKVGNRKFYYGLAKYKEGELWGHINKKGEIVIPLQWKYAADFYDGLAAVQTTEGRWGFIDTQGNYQIRPQFACVVYFNEGLAAATLTGYGKNCQGGKWGFINKSGNWQIQPIFDSTETVFKNGIAKVTYNGQTGYIDKQGQWVDYQEPNNAYGNNPYPVTAYQIKDLYSNFSLTYKDSGIVGAKIWVENCYAKSANKIGCYHFDQLSSLVDSIMAKENGFPQDPFFKQDRVELRAIRNVPEFQKIPSSTFRVVVNETVNEILKNTHLFK